MRVAILTTDSREHYADYSAPRAYFGTAPEALLQGFASLSNVEIHVLSCARARLKDSEQLAPNIFFHSLYVPKVGWMRTGYQGCIRAVRKKLKEIKPAIVHGQGTERDCAMSAAFSGYPNVLTLHGIMREMAKILHARPGSYYWLASLLESIALRRASGAICISNYTCEMLRARCRKTWFVPNALSEKFFTEPSANAESNECKILNVGTICSYKQQNELLEVLEELHRDGLKFKALFLGSASRNSDYATTFLNRVHARPYLAYGGFKSRDELIRLYDNASGLVHVSAIETFGLGVAEALARNLKFIGFKSGGVADVIRQVDLAEGFEDQDWPGLKAALAKWITSGFPRAQSAAEVMRERYHPVPIARRHMEIYREVLRQARVV